MSLDELNNTSIGKLMEPEAISYSFNTPGWYIVAAGLLLIAFIIVFIQIRNYQLNAYRRQAIRQINALSTNSNHLVVYEINKLIKTTAICLYGRLRVGALHGTEWFNFLKASMKADINFDFEAFTQAIYNPSISSTEINKAFFEFARLWFLKHKTDV
jgi:hypothetical protein